MKNNEFLALSKQIEQLKEKINKTEKVLLTKHHKKLSKNLTNYIKYKTKLEKLMNS